MGPVHTLVFCVFFHGTIIAVRGDEDDLELVAGRLVLLVEFHEGGCELQAGPAPRCGVVKEVIFRGFAFQGESLEGLPVEFLQISVKDLVEDARDAG